MKKNLLSIVILALLVVNIILTTLMLFTVMKNEQSTGKVVSDIASALSLELDKGDGTENTAISMADTAVYEFAENMTITLKPDEGDTQTHYCICKVSLSMNINDPDYATYSEQFETYAGLIKSEILSVVSSYTYSEAQISQQQICDQILERIQELYQSEFIYKVSFSEFMFG